MILVFEGRTTKALLSISHRLLDPSKMLTDFPEFSDRYLPRSELPGAFELQGEGVMFVRFEILV
jgi:hypothetical protein